MQLGRRQGAKLGRMTEFFARSGSALQTMAACRSLTSAVVREPAARRAGAAPLVARSADEAVAGIRRGDSLFVHSVAHAPTELLSALVQRQDLDGVTLSHIHIEGPAPHMSPAAAGRFRARNFFCGHNAREAVNAGRADYSPAFLSDIPGLFRRGVVKFDAALLTVSTPDANGFCRLGTSVDVARAAASCAAKLIAVVSPRVPRTNGDTLVHISQLDVVLERDTPLHAAAPRVAANEEAAEAKIGKLLAEEIVKDGATLQLGIGGIPNAMLSNLKGHRELNVYSEMISDGVMELSESGAISGSNKVEHPGRITVGFAVGSEKFYKWLDDNHGVVFKDIGYVNEVHRIASQPRMVSVNSAIEIDLTGQVVADSIGERIFSGVGGAVDFVRGASLSPGGISVIALPSTTHSGVSRIVAQLQPGAGVVTTRAHVQHVATEFGIAHLQGRTLGERAKALIAIAHPSAREALTAAARKRKII